MLMAARVLLLSLTLLVTACARSPQTNTVLAAGAIAPASPRAAFDAYAAGSPVRPIGPAARSHPGFAALPDRGELVAYSKGQGRRDGAYIWYRADLSESHALHAIADGHLRVTAPSGEVLDFRYDHHVEHPSGDWTWVGHIDGREGEQTIITFGEHAAFGTIAQPGKLPLRLTARGGVGWLVETDPRKIAGIVNAVTRPQRPDYLIVPRATASAQSPVPAADTKAAPSPFNSAEAGMATATTTTLDVVLGYTLGFAADNGGDSAATTRLYQMVAVANQTYQNSQIDAQVRLVGTVKVNYTDTTTNDSALEQLTGYDSTSQRRTTPNAAFTALRAAREQYGADLVSLVRSFRDPENDGCGIAWLIGGGRSGIQAGDGSDYYGYSVVSDGTDAGTDGKTYYCLDETLAHELAHNMGAAHDMETAKGDDNVLDADEYGAFAYSFGYKATAATGNFYTVMAYGDSGQRIYRTFSNPRITFCGGRACGIANQADNARGLSQTIATVASFRATRVTDVARALRNDFTGSGRSDILWRKVNTGSNTIWKSADIDTPQTVVRVPDLSWKIAGTGDFNGDGAADILWRNVSTGSNAIWGAADVNRGQTMAAVRDLNWTIVGVGDFDGDGVSDILWRNTRTGANAIWKRANSATQQSLASASDLNWYVAGVGDFNADGLSDILWRNRRTGENSVWRSADIGQWQPTASVTDLNWKIVGIGDVNGDAAWDIVWRNASTGSNVIWRGANAVTGQTMVKVPDRAWTVVEVADFDGDGRDDLLWRNFSTGANVIWAAANAGDQRPVATVPDLNWHAVP